MARRKISKWTEETIKAEILRVMEILQLTERLPSLEELAKHTTCGYSVGKYWGMQHFAELIGLPDAGAYNRQKVKKTCPICGKEFLGARGTAVYCSQACADTREHTCPECGKVFLGSSSKTYCSKACRQKAGRREREKELEVSTTYDNIRPSRAFAKVKVRGMAYADIQKLENPVEPINLAAYAGMKTWAERKVER